MKKLISFILVLVLMLSLLSINTLALSPALRDYGDINNNGQVDIMDATLIQRYLAKVITFTDFQTKLADVSDDGGVSILDATMIQQYKAKIISELPRNPVPYISIVNIKAVTRSIHDSRVEEGTEVSFTVHASVINGPNDFGELRYEYDLSSSTNGTKHFEATDSNVFTFTFPKAGIYVLHIRAYDKEYDCKDEAHIVYEVAESYPYDSDFVYVEYDDKKPEYALNSYPKKPENCDIEYEMMYSKSCIYNAGEMLNNSGRYDFACLIDSKEQYDAVFKIENDKYDDAFFEENSLVAIVTYLSCHEAEGVLDCVCVNGDALYIDVNEYLDLPDGMGVSPTTPNCILIAKVSKADVAGVSDIDWIH